MKNWRQLSNSRYQEFISILIECFFHNIFSFLSGLSIIRQALFLVYIQVILQLHYHIVAKSVLLAHTGLAVFTNTSAYPHHQIHLINLGFLLGVNDHWLIVHFLNCDTSGVTISFLLF